MEVKTNNTAPETTTEVNAPVEVPRHDITIQQTLAFNEIVAYEYLGDFQKAAVLIRTYLNTYPDDANAQREYDFLSTR